MKNHAAPPPAASASTTTKNMPAAEDFAGAAAPRVSSATVALLAAARAKRSAIRAPNDLRERKTSENQQPCKCIEQRRLAGDGTAKRQRRRRDAGTESLRVQSRKKLIKNR